MRPLNNIFILLLLTTFSACKETPENVETPVTKDTGQVIIPQSQWEGGQLEIGEMEIRNFPVIVRTTGLIDVPPANRAVINAFMGGYIKNTPLLVGDFVKKGEALVTLENPEFIALQQDYLDASEQLKYLKADFDRQQTMLNENITSEKKFLQAESDYRRNLARYNGLRQKLQMLNINPAQAEAGRLTSQVTIYAPISGSVSRVNVTTGTYVSPTDVIMEIIDRDEMHLELIAFEKDVMSIRKGQNIWFRTPEATKETFMAQVYLVGTAIDVQKRTVPVHGHLPDSIADRFSVGMFVEADIATTTTQYPSLPEEAVITQDGYSYVLQLEKEENGNRIFVKKEVNPVTTYQGFTALENSTGFKPTDLFLLKGTYNFVEN